MKLAIFGATGSIGTQLVRQALAAGHHVTAFVRDPARLDVDDPGLRFVTGDVMTDPEQIRQTVDGQDAVLIAFWLGQLPFGDTRRISDRPKFIIARAAAPIFSPRVGPTSIMTGGVDTYFSVGLPSHRRETACR